MLNKDIISEYLKNRDALNADFNRTSLFAPAAGVGNQMTYDDPGFPGSSAGGFIPRPYIPPTARSNPFVEGMLQSPSIAGLLDPGTLDPDWSWDSTLDAGYVPPTLAEYGKTMFDLYSKVSPAGMLFNGIFGGREGGPAPVTYGGGGGFVGIPGGNQTVQTTIPGSRPVVGSMWGTPFSGTDPGDVSADSGGWGADIGLPGYSGSTADFGLD